MSLLVGAWTMGLILAILALGVYVSFRIFRFSDITVDGSITLGAAVSAVLLTEGLNPFIATLLAFVAGLVAGATTGVLHTKFKIDRLLSGILMMTALYSINLRIMGVSNLSLPKDKTTLSTYAERLGHLISGGEENVSLFGREVSAHDLAMLVLVFIATTLVGLALYAFFKTDLGTAMRATGDNDQMTRALGVNVDGMVIAGLALANGLVALSGALLAQYQGFADLQMGIGIIVWGLASVIVGEALVGGQFQLGLALTGAVMGSVLFRLLVAMVLQRGLNPNDLKLFTAVFLFLVLIAPDLIGKLREKLRQTDS